MSAISRLESITNVALPGVTIFPLGEQAVAGVPQEVLVCSSPGVTIPPHTHSVDARMIIVSGGAEVLSDDAGLAGRHVAAGDVVFFERNVAHGFRAFDSGLAFISRNGGIVDTHDAHWDMEFVSGS
jgi:quercetin dioxygenase-like cupin family protein